MLFTEVGEPKVNRHRGVGLKDVILALEQLMKLFRFERVLYLIVSLVAFVLLIYAALKLFTEQSVTVGAMTSVLGGSGLGTVASARVVFFLRRAFDIVEVIVRGVDHG